MPVTFEQLTVGETYERPHLAKLWGYKRYNAFAKGVFTPANENKIVLFVTEDQQMALTQYEDHLQEETLTMDGETAHTTDDRIIRAKERGDQIHLFHRDRHHRPFTYLGEVRLVSHARNAGDEPSKFQFKLLEAI